MPEAGTEQETAPPPRFLLRPAGVLTQLLCAFSLLLGTISVILVQQNKTGGIALVIVWAVAAMAGVVFGGLMSRGGMLSVIASALIVGAFGTVLLVLDWDALRSLLRLLPEDDVSMIADILVAVAVAMIATSVLSVASIPQARAYNRALREAEAEAEKSGFFEAQTSGALPTQVQVPITIPGRATRTMSVPPDPALMATERAPEPSPYAPPPNYPYVPPGAPPSTIPPQGFAPPQGGSFGVEPAVTPRRRTAPSAVAPMPTAAPAPGMAFRAGAGSSVAHTSAMAPYPGAPPQSPALAPAYRDANAPAYGNANATLPYAPHAHDGPPSMPVSPHVHSASPHGHDPQLHGHDPHSHSASPHGHSHGHDPHSHSASAHAHSHGHDPHSHSASAHAHSHGHDPHSHSASHGRDPHSYGAPRSHGAYDLTSHGAPHSHGAHDPTSHGAPHSPGQDGPSTPAPLHATPELPTAPLHALPGSFGTRRDGSPSMPPPMGAMPAPNRVSDRLPLPAPPPSHDGYAPPPAPAGEVPESHSTAPGWTPSPVRTYTTMMSVSPPQVERRSRRRVYMILGGFAIGLGAGVGVLVSSMQDEKREELATSSSPTGSSASTGSSTKPTAASSTKVPTETTASSTTPTTDAGTVAVVVDAGTIDAAPPPPIHNFLDTQRDLIGRGDLAQLAQTFAPTSFAFGIDADDVAEGRDAIEAMLTKNLGDPPPDGFKVTSRFVAIGQEGPAAWTAEELELSGPNLAPRRLVITQALVANDGAWSVIALCWAQTVRDDTAERLAVLGTLPKPRPLVDKIEGEELGAVAKAAFASRKAFADARSERDDAFNFGSGPGERIVGGPKIKALFARLRSELRLDGGVRVITAGTVGIAALNAVYTAKGRAATDVSQTFRVLAVFLKEDTAWRIVQTQFSNAGPINE